MGSLRTKETPLPYERVLLELGWSQAELCRRLGLSTGAPRRWAEIDPDTGDAKGPPKYVVAYLDLALSLKVLADKVEKGR